VFSGLGAFLVKKKLRSRIFQEREATTSPVLCILMGSIESNSTWIESLQDVTIVSYETAHLPKMQERMRYWDNSSNACMMEPLACCAPNIFRVEITAICAGTDD